MSTTATPGLPAEYDSSFVLADLTQFVMLWVEIFDAGRSRMLVKYAG